MRIDLEMLAGKYHGGRAELLDDGRAVEPDARRQRGAIIDRRVAECAAEIDRAADFGAGIAPSRVASLGMLRPLDQAEARDAEVDQLDLLLAGIVVAEGLQCAALKAPISAGQEARIDRAAGRGDAHLHRLAGVANVGLAHQPDARALDAVALRALPPPRASSAA